MPRRASWEFRQWIGDVSPNHQRYYHIEYASPMFTRASPMCLGHFWPWYTSPNVRRLLGAVRQYYSVLFGDISPMVFGVKTSGENFNARIEIFLDVPMLWRSMAITRVRRRSFTEPLVHAGAALAMPKCVLRESIGRLKKPRGTVALDTFYSQ